MEGVRGVGLGWGQGGGVYGEGGGVRGGEEGELGDGL